MCSINDDWENCAAPPAPRRTQAKSKSTTENESIGNTDQADLVRNPEPDQDNAVRDGPSTETTEPRPCGSQRDDIETLRARIDTDRQLLLAMASAIVIMLVMNVAVQIRIDNLLGRSGPLQ